MTPLEMAKNAAAAVERIAEIQSNDPLTAYVHRLGTQGFQSAQVAGYMALVSIATDLHRIADVIELGPLPVGEVDE